MAHTSHHGSTPDQDLNLLAKLGYETRDVALNTLVKWLVALFIFIGFASGFALGLYKLFVPTYAEEGRVSPLIHLRTPPPNPQIQAEPRRDMVAYWKREDALIKTKTPGENGTTNLPIGQAMDLLAQQGISGITEDQPTTPYTKAYPGSGDHSRDRKVKADDMGGTDGNFESIAYPNPLQGSSITPPGQVSPAPADTNAPSAALAPEAE